MEYQDFIQTVTDLDFIEDQETADAAIKAVLGVLASRLEASKARKLTENFPGPLNLENLRSHQVGITSIPAEGYIAQMTTQFRLTDEQAEKLVRAVLHTAREAAGDSAWNEIKDALPEDWVTFISKV